ncbi:MAG: NIPSNAP family protein [Providencia heimbachae]|nr:NIPSNAP family protein [Providencia heimbachae]
MKNKVIEILQYNLKEGTGKKFHKVMRDVSVPLHRAKGIDVVSFGNSLHDSDCYYLIRAFSSMNDLNSTQSEFYKSDEWLSGPRIEIIEAIGTSIKTIMELPEFAIEVLRVK